MHNVNGHLKEREDKLIFAIRQLHKHVSINLKRISLNPIIGLGLPPNRLAAPHTTPTKCDGGSPALAAVSETIRNVDSLSLNAELCYCWRYCCNEVHHQLYHPYFIHTSGQCDESAGLLLKRSEKKTDRKENRRSCERVS